MGGEKAQTGQKPLFPRFTLDCGIARGTVPILIRLVEGVAEFHIVEDPGLDYPKQPP